MGDAVKLHEAETLMKAARKATTKTLLKWTLDWDSGASDFEKAALIYANMLKLDMAKDAFELAAQAHDKAGNLFHAARCLETVATLFKDNGRGDLSAEFYVRASRFFAKDNKQQQQCDCLVKASRLVPTEQVSKAVAWLREGIEALEDSDRRHMVPEVYRSLVILQLRCNLYLDAIGTLKKLIYNFEKLSQPQNAAKSCLEIVVILLNMQDTVLAQREFQALSSGFGFAGSKEQPIAYELIQAADSRDQERLTELGKEQVFTFLTVDVSRMAKKLRVPAGSAPVMAVGAPTSAGTTGAAAAAAAAAEPDPEDTN